MDVGFQSGTVLLEKYRVESVLGRGGMGVVLRVTHLHLGEELAIKIYACAAHDLDAARRYYAKVPTQDQHGVEQRCIHENLIIR